MVPQVRWVDSMLRNGPQQADDFRFESIPDFSSHINVDDAGVEKKVVVRTQAQHVALLVWPIMRMP
jgi:hypothetical protein